MTYIDMIVAAYVVPALVALAVWGWIFFRSVVGYLAARHNAKGPLAREVVDVARHAWVVPLWPVFVTRVLWYIFKIISADAKDSK